MRKLTRRGKAILAAAVISAVAVNAGAAWAYWRVKGSGTGSGTAGSVVALEASGTTAGGALLYPGVRRTIRITATNKNPFDVVVSQIKSGTTPVVVDAEHVAKGCVKSGVRLHSAPYTTSRLIRKNSTTSFDLTNALTMTNESDNACQGATFTVPIVIVAVAQS